MQNQKRWIELEADEKIVQQLQTELNIHPVLCKLLEDLIQNNHFVEEEGERIVDQFFLNLRTDLDTIQGSLQSRLDILLTKLNLQTVQHLKEDIEKNMNDLKQTSSLLLKSFSDKA